jgi:hypothetical protein
MTTEKGKGASRERWSTKMKAQVLTVMTMVFLIVVIILAPHAFAHTDKYYIGYSQGQAKANDDYSLVYNGHNYYRPFCPSVDAWTEANGPHSSNFCAGLIDGYNAQWTSLAPNFMQQHWNRVNNQQIGQNSNRRIDGNGNRVVVNQGASNSAGSEGSSSSGSNGHGFQPQCRILCSVIKVG